MAIEKSENIWHNGKLIPWDEATIHVCRTWSTTALGV